MRMPDRNIAWAIRLGVLVTLLVLMCVVTPVYLWIQAYGSISGPAAMAFATILPLIICPTLSFIMLRTRLRIYRLAEQNYKIAHKDELTGLPNRRARPRNNARRDCDGSINTATGGMPASSR